MRFYHSKKLTSFSNLTHAFTTKESRNLAFHVGDNQLSVEENHQNLANELLYNRDSLVHMKQIHSDLVHIVSGEDDFLNPPTCDALITDKTDTPLMVMVADCTPVLFYDDKQKVIAVAHAGRAGAFKNIVKNVIECFRDAFKSDSKDIYVSVGASIGVCCYEVGSDIFEEASKIGLSYAFEKRNNSYYLDINKILLNQLLECKIKKENIEIINECSCCNTQKYFSYRAEKNTGRFAGVLMIKK
ncbi:peptidoglycan editing factor PgeF [Sulfurimonas sp.]|uniref:peptidoglycan editing factor PgeF n=1 Tax=Sulfurimonas sp. TaxID=2022749 RepID=UPI0025D085A8|nr:peptidoglycan editing factor PgeF [Sulfurimonas sp.]MDD5157463.1 peptidoglycan editing factor PgeF [Sulfurimonas sp.]